ncbi:MAG TPA: VWA domain-containing protein [Candidatus Eisenbacteria bacterium]|nr:VWA domain-containing protein [Candidatus Eisenbacteria bacterium]
MMRRMLALVCASALSAPFPLTARAQQASTPQSAPAIRATTELVLVNVVARDKKGNLVRNLKQQDFTVLEDGQRQQVASFDFENIDELALAQQQTVTATGESEPASSAPPTQPAERAADARDRRLILLFFDFSAMDPEQIDRAVDAAKQYVNTKMKSADLIAIVSLTTNMRLDLNFTDEKAKILSTLSAYNSSSGQGFDNGATGSSEGSPETGGAFTADDTDYNTFSADRKLLALQSIIQSVGKLSQKKSLIYFSNGISQSGVDNQSALRAATAAAVKANVAIYPLDVRGLQALPAGGEAQNASLHGQSAYSGASVLNDLNSNASTQETLSTLAADTGGKAFFDSNDFSGIFSQVQKDTSAYYILGYSSSNHLKNGRFRHIKVVVNRPDLKLEYRAGYYAGRDFEHSGRADREAQLQDELASDLPATDVAVYAGTAYFRRDDSHYFLAVSMVVPGSQIPFVQEKDRDSATLDIAGVILEGGKFQVGQLRDTVKLAVDSTQQVRRKNVQYNTSFLLAPGGYHLKFVVRENRTGRMGTFEADVQIPDLRKVPLRSSSVVLSSLRVPAAGKNKSMNPLIGDQTELVPNITHVFTQDQHLYLQFEVYDAVKGKPTPVSSKPAAGAASDQPAAKLQGGTIRVLTSVQFMQNNVKIYESKPIIATEVNLPQRKAVGFQLDLPLRTLKPGFYTCQVNIIDDVAGNYAFPRWAMLIKEPAAVAPAAPVSSAPSSTGSSQRM